jgi:hypothetical protein
LRASFKRPGTRPLGPCSLPCAAPASEPPSSTPFAECARGQGFPNPQPASPNASLARRCTRHWRGRQELAAAARGLHRSCPAGLRGRSCSRRRGARREELVLVTGYDVCEQVHTIDLALRSGARGGGLGRAETDGRQPEPWARRPGGDTPRRRASASATAGRPCPRHPCPLQQPPHCGPQAGQQRLQAPERTHTPPSAHQQHLHDDILLRLHIHGPAQVLLVDGVDLLGRDLDDAPLRCGGAERRGAGERGLGSCRQCTVSLERGKRAMAL